MKNVENIEAYDYRDAVYRDVRNAIENSGYRDSSEFEDREEYEEYLNDVLWTDDSVTGNGSGSYTFSAFEAGLNLAGNGDLCEEVANEFGTDLSLGITNPESLDVSIRCYLLGEMISLALDDLDLEYGTTEEENE